MTMNDHEGEGVRVSEMTTWSGGLKFCISDQKMVAGILHLSNCMPNFRIVMWRWYDLVLSF